MSRFTLIPIKYSQLENVCRKSRRHRAEYMRALFLWLFRKDWTRATPAADLANHAPGLGPGPVAGE